VICCECRRPIRSLFYRCSEVCVHHDPESDTACAVAKHQYTVCRGCYLSTTHTRQHLQKTRPFDPLSAQLEPPLNNAERAAMAKDIARLQKHEDAREDRKDGKRFLRMASLAAPDIFQRYIVPFGNVHAAVTFGPLVFEIGARQ
jgi:hypothetical protein